MRYTLFNQKGCAYAYANSIGEITVAGICSGLRFYFIANDRNEVVVNEMKGRPLPKRTSHGTVTEFARG